MADLCETCKHAIVTSGGTVTWGKGIFIRMVGNHNSTCMRPGVSINMDSSGITGCSGYEKKMEVFDGKFIDCDRG